MLVSQEVGVGDNALEKAREECLTRAYELFEPYIPLNTQLFIETAESRIFTGYILRLQYTSKRSGRTMCTIAKGNNLPDDEDALFYWYLRQLVLTPAEQGREFSRLYFLEKRARQEMFLAQGKLGNIRVSEGSYHKDALSYKEYA